MIKHKLTLFFYYYIYVSISFFFAPYLKNVKGFEPEIVGYLTTLGLLFLIISFFLSGMIADKINSNKKIIAVNLAISFLVILGLVFINNHFILSALYILSYSNFIMITSQLDGLVIRDLNDTTLYAGVRAFGSFGAAISYALNSFALSGISLETNLLFNAGLVIVLIILISSIHEHHYEKNASISEYRAEVANAVAIKPVLYILVITFLTYGTLSADDAYQVMYNMEIVGISAGVMGIIGLVSIFSEGSFMMVHKRILKRLGIAKTINIAVITLLVIYITRFTLYTSPVVINAGSVMMGLFIGFYIPSVMLIINKFIEDTTKNIFLSFYQIMIRIGGVLIGLITTIFYDTTGSLQGIYLLHSVMIAMSLYVIYLLSKEVDGIDFE
ncbi:MFS transporter [Mollicutes bacterium LVI A0039]|nr:MFS transporter [Mollicutes bacterium LVI A0039]